jgi:hypothetical protein
MIVDPKDSAEVGENIHTGYRFDECLMISGRLFGPLISGLAPHAADLCIVHGVRTDTVAHGRGEEEIEAGRLALGPGETIWTALSEAAPGDEPIAFMRIPVRPAARKSGQFPDGDAIQLARGLDDGNPVLVDPDLMRRGVLRSEPLPRWFEKLADNKAELARSVLPDADIDAYVARQRTSNLLWKLLASTPSASDLDFGPDIHADALRVAFQAIRSRTAKVIDIMSPELWFDTHTAHIQNQTARVRGAFYAVGKFIEALKQTRDEHGSLFEQTTIVIHTELGRYPKFNGNDGKDHWPENSWMFAGKGIRPVTIGATDDHYRGLPVDYRTGSTAGPQARPIYPDAISATLLQLVGATPSKYGFRNDEILWPLLARA